MAKTLLRSGDLDDFQAVGGGGQAVFASALQIRETLRLRKQQALVDCLAIPQVNDEGDRVDWYAPVEGQVTSWKAADDDQRHRALRMLEKLADGADSLSRKCLQSDKTAQQLFGALLEKTLQFPGENHVFLIDGKPVITFWGFVNLNERARDDRFSCLQTTTLDAPLVAVEPEADPLPAPKITLAQPDEPLLAPPVQVIAEPKDEPELPPQAPVLVESAPAPVAAETTAAARQRRIPLWSLPAAALMIAAVAAPLLWTSQSAAPVAPVTAQAEPPEVLQPPPVPALTTTLPLHQASVSALRAEEKPQEKTQNKPVVIAAIPKDALVMDAGQMRAGTTRFLNGSWRVIVDVKDPVTGKAPSLRYQLLNNKGSARLVHGDNVVCRADIFSGLHQNGELMIKSRGSARCSDGSRYPMPEISCKAGTSDVAECTGRYDANTVVPLTFRKVGA
ncbi:SrfA family protein [[Enterobacter] lignolyticus]|uniref:SsrAB activated protein n=1 Tax=Enterobacter lignolyticus (strain SCF1) TaxID=701347 RepID=E3G840_ENTLS|nr:SrfA family protein [[Enterobacter] lignolyticus]ADO48628.1 ssrAB activated protein [[Enterobacter] lignolyticus SCF1]